MASGVCCGVVDRDHVTNLQVHHTIHIQKQCACGCCALRKLRKVQRELRGVGKSAVARVFDRHHPIVARCGGQLRSHLEAQSVVRNTDTVRRNDSASALATRRGTRLATRRSDARCFRSRSANEQLINVVNCARGVVGHKRVVPIIQPILDNELQQRRTLRKGKSCTLTNHAPALDSVAILR